MHNAYFNDELTIAPLKKGKLDAKRFAVKDVFHVKGYRNSAGNPTWLKTHDPAEETALAILKLLNEGATLKGMTHTDELMYSLNGENIHYGTPVNPNGRQRVPGGSSSGSASAVATNSVPFALGTDTGGSVRVPSAYCGIYGFRPTHDVVSMEGVIPLASSFDTVGWMARSADVLKTVGEVLLPITNNQPTFKKVLLDVEAWSYLSELDFAILTNVLSKCELPVENIRLTKEGLDRWATTFRFIQGMEIWQQHKDWIIKEQPVFGADIAERFRWASRLDVSELPRLMQEKQRISQYVTSLLEEDCLLVIPTVPAVAPLIGVGGKELESNRTNTMKLTCIAGLCGLPQVTMPVRNSDGLPIGLSFIASKGQDLALLQFVEMFGGS